MNIAKIATRVISKLPEIEGSSVKTVFKGKQARKMLDEMIKDAKDMPAPIKAKLKAVKDPVIEMAGKSKKQYSITGMRLKDGENVIASGAVSITGKGENALVKTHIATGEHLAEEGKAHYDVLASGHIQGAKKVTPEADVALSNRGTTIKGKFANDTMGANLEVDKKFMQQFPALKAKYNEFISKFSAGTSHLMSKFKEIVTGKYKTFEERLAEMPGVTKEAVSGSFEKIKSPEVTSAELKKAFAKKMETENVEAHIKTESSKAIKELQAKYKNAKKA